MNKAKHFCRVSGCKNLCTGKYCIDHAALEIEDEKRRQNAWNAAADKRRGSATERGYDHRWRTFRDAYLRRPENRFCKLHYSGCTVIADCIDHITPLALGGEKYALDNLQPACTHCNVIKGRKTARGTYVYGQDGDSGYGAETGTF